MVSSLFQGVSSIQNVGDQADTDAGLPHALSNATA
jgi:hypothetical protein